MQNTADIDFERAGFDAKPPGQFSLQWGDVVILRLCHTKSRAMSIAYRLNRLGAQAALYFDQDRPALAMFEWHLSPEQGKQAQQILRPLRVREAVHQDIFLEGDTAADGGP